MLKSCGTRNGVYCTYQVDEWRGKLSPTIGRNSVIGSSAPFARRCSRLVSRLLVVVLVLFAADGCFKGAVPLHDEPVGRFKVYFNNDRMTDGEPACDAVFPVQRSAVSATNLRAAALKALFRGPTPEERSRGYRSYFSQRTDGLLRRLAIRVGTAYVDLYDRRDELGGATSSCGSAEFFSQIEHTLAQFPGIDRIIFAIDGNPRVFYDWMELECDSTNDNCDPAPFASANRVPRVDHA